MALATGLLRNVHVASSYSSFLPGSSELIAPIERLSHMSAAFSNRDTHACIAGKKDACVSRFEKAGLMCESLSIGAMSSLDPGKKLEYDEATYTFRNSPVASAMLKRTYRDGWKVANL